MLGCGTCVINPITYQLKPITLFVAEFARQFGIDWRLLLSQAVNFLIVLLVLRMFVYKPIRALLKERVRRVKEGMDKAAEADRRLEDAQEMVRDRLKNAEGKATALLRDVEERAREREAVLIESSRRKGEVLLAEAARSIEVERIKARQEVEKEARMLVREALVHIVEMNPQEVDDALIGKVVAGIVSKKQRA